jgi:hypothetical protein
LYYLIDLLYPSKTTPQQPQIVRLPTEAEQRAVRAEQRAFHESRIAFLDTLDNSSTENANG